MAVVVAGQLDAIESGAACAARGSLCMKSDLNRSHRRNASRAERKMRSALQCDPVLVADFVREFSSLDRREGDVPGSAKKRTRQRIRQAIDGDDLTPSSSGKAIPRRKFCDWAWKCEDWRDKLQKMAGFSLVDRNGADVSFEPMSAGGFGFQWQPNDIEWLRTNFAEAQREIFRQRVEINLLQSEVEELRKRVADFENKKRMHSEQMSVNGKKAGRGNSKD